MFVVPNVEFVESFGIISVDRPELGDVFCSVEQMIYPLRFYFVSPVFGRIPFLFLVQFLRRLVGICQFSWFRPGNQLYAMVYCLANTADQPPARIPYYR